MGGGGWAAAGGSLSPPAPHIVTFPTQGPFWHILSSYSEGYLHSDIEGWSPDRQGREKVGDK